MKESLSFNEIVAKVIKGIFYMIIAIVGLWFIGRVAEAITPEKFNDDSYEEMYIDRGTRHW